VTDPKPGRLSVPHAIARELVLATSPDYDPHAGASRLRKLADWILTGAPPKAPRAPRDPVAVSADVHAVFGYWCQVFHKNAATKLTDDRAKAIADRLAEGATVERCKLAIDGCKSSPTHNGTKDGNVYNEIGLIFRNADKLDAFVSRAPKRTQWVKPREEPAEPKEPIADLDDPEVKARLAEQLAKLTSQIGRKVG
jgi:hypothetical protein